MMFRSNAAVAACALVACSTLNAALGAQTQTAILPSTVNPTLAGGLVGINNLNTAAPVRQVALYQAFNFANRGITGPILIEGIRFRPSPTGLSFSAQNIPAMRIGLSTARVEPGVSPLINGASYPFPFDQVIGDDAVDLFQGGVTVPAFSGAPTSNLTAEPFWLELNTNQPGGTGVSFLYDPGQGAALALEIDGNGVPNVQAVPALDYASQATASSVYATGSAVPIGAATASEAKVPVIELVYRPANGFRPDFIASGATGPSPLTVSFNNSTTYAANTIPLGTSWDLDGDGIFESSGANVQFTYTGCGDFDVTMRTVQQDILSADQVVGQVRKVGVIQTDLFSTQFTQSLAVAAVGETVDFAYVGPAGVTNSWDLDGDGTQDAQGNMPSFAYTAPGNYTIELTTVRNCRTNTTTGSIDIVDGVVEPAFPGAQSIAAGDGAGCFFDLQVGVPSGITVQALRFASQDPGQPHLIEIYGQVGNSVDGRFDLLSFTLLGSVQHTPSMPGVPELVDVTDFALPVGTHGIALIQRSVMGSQVSQDLVIQAPGVLGATEPVRLVPWGATADLDTQGIATPSLATDRAFAGALLYSRGGAPLAPGSVAKFGNGCDGALGRPTIATLATQPPTAGAVFPIRVANVPGAMVMHIGLSSTFNATFGVPLPLPLGPLLGTKPACRFRVSSEFIAPLSVAVGGFAVTNVPIPNSPFFVNREGYFQAVVFDGTVPGNLVVSDAHVGVIQ